MTSFLRGDGRALTVVEGFRERVLSYRPSVSPTAGWTEEQLTASAEKKRRRFERMHSTLEGWFGPLDGARVLDVGCGDGANCVLLAAEAVRLAVGLDLRLRLFAPDGEGEVVRRLIERVDAAATRSGRAAASHRPARFVNMDATRLGFRPDSFDLVISRSAAEHIQPIERALHETCRVVRPGGLVYLSIDPFFWLRGCHKRGVVDLPFAHARLSLPEYRRFVAETEGEARAAKRAGRLATLNRFTVSDWRRSIESHAWEVLGWTERPSELGAAILRENPEIMDTLLPGVEERDLLTERIDVWLRRRR
ncbi:MAG TPA: class I SAM-dependent methyltransferase [Vicinamibacteria bacterium]|nr:class I SAM-dependent methyltransferase [Vicinamibacteria bacterium]